MNLITVLPHLHYKPTVFELLCLDLSIFIFSKFSYIYQAFSTTHGVSAVLSPFSYLLAPVDADTLHSESSLLVVGELPQGVIGKRFILRVIDFCFPISSNNKLTL